MFGVAPATSPDVRFVDQSAYGGSVPAALRSLDASFAFGILPALAANAGSVAGATPNGLKERPHPAPPDAVVVGKLAGAHVYRLVGPHIHVVGVNLFGDVGGAVGEGAGPVEVFGEEAGPRRPGNLSGVARRTARHRHPQPLTGSHATVRMAREKGGFKAVLPRPEKSGSGVHGRRATAAPARSFRSPAGQNRAAWTKW